MNRKTITIVIALAGALLLAVTVASVIARKGDVFAIGETVRARLGSQWLRAKVLKRNDSHYYVHFEGRSEDDDQWVSVYQMEKLSGFGKDFKTSGKNTRAYKLSAEFEYFCRKDAERKRLQGSRAAAFVAHCRASRQAALKRPGAPTTIGRFDPARPLAYDIHRGCMGQNYRYCADKCGYHSRKFCLPQCLEKVEKCKSNFYYDVDLNKHCNEKGAAEWQMANYNKNYNKGGRSVWILPNVYFDDRKDPLLYQCAAPLAKRMAARDACSSLERCNAVCQVNPKSQSGASTTAACKRKCRSWFPRRKCRSFVSYQF